MNDFPLHLIPLLPLAGAAINLVAGKRFSRGANGIIACTAVFMSALLGWEAAFRLHQAGPHAVFMRDLLELLGGGDWIHATEVLGAASVHLTAGLLMDRLSSLMVLIITTVGFLIHVYSTAYMEEDRDQARYFGYLNLFTGMMLILVLGDSLPVTFVGWEGVGLCSYLLIGFWFDKEQNANAGRKAFIVNRIGDFGFLLGMFLLFSATSTLTYRELTQPQALASLHQIVVGRATVATIACLLLFVGATGKSAQLPLYVWLPDAMAGPTPVSALIHAATMVTAGVYMIARLHVLFELDPFVLAVIAIVGALTALFAATIGIVQKPVKKILAYSTVSQLGFMFIGVGTRAYTAGTFHLLTHAFFKAGLFLGAGSIMHALHGEEDVTRMGGLKDKLPITRWTFLIYCLAIAGIPPLAGFFSKDHVLASAFSFDYAEMPDWPHWLGHAIYAVGLVAAACTAFYMFRCYFLVFHGEYRGDRHTFEHAHESPLAMSVPLIVLAVGAALLGFLGIPDAIHHDANLFEEWLVPSNFAPQIEHQSAGAEWGLMALALGVSLGGIFLARSFYLNGPSETVVRIAEGWPRLYRAVLNKYWVDELYDRVFVRTLRSIGFVFWKVVDGVVIDLVLVRGSALAVDVTGRVARFFQNGDAQRYVVGTLVGTVGIIAVSANWVACTAAPFEVEVHGADVSVTARGLSRSAQQRPLDYVFDFGEGKPEKRADRAAHHHYAATGKHKITVTVHDPRWDVTSSESRTVVTQ